MTAYKKCNRVQDLQVKIFKLKYSSDQGACGQYVKLILYNFLKRSACGQHVNLISYQPNISHAFQISHIYAVASINKDKPI